MSVQFKFIFIALVYFLYSLTFSGYLLLTSLGLAFSLYIFLSFLSSLGKKIALKELIILIAAAQWIVGAKIGYNIGKTHYRYYMYVEEEVYMNFVVPGLFLFYLGIKIIANQLELNRLPIFVETNRELVKKCAKTILVIGLSSLLISRFIRIPQLAFILYLLNILPYIAALYYMCLYPRQRINIFLVSILFALFLSLQSGLFHDMIILAAFLSFFLFNQTTSLLKKLTLISLGFFSLYTIQLVKAEYRAIIWESKGSTGVVNAFYTVLEKEFFPEPSMQFNNQAYLEEEEEKTNVTTRLNQGWIISKVMENVPKNQAYLGGETIREALESSFLPRFLFPNKKGAEQALVNFTKVTGLGLNKGTSMGLSVIAEFYANYGVSGAWLAMFLYGLSLALIIKFIIVVLGANSPLMLLWFLLFFFQVIKAETELIKIINHLLKSILFFIALRFLLRLFNLEILPHNKALMHD